MAASVVHNSFHVPSHVIKGGREGGKREEERRREEGRERQREEWSVMLSDWSTATYLHSCRLQAG